GHAYQELRRRRNDHSVRGRDPRTDDGSGKGERRVIRRAAPQSAIGGGIEPSPADLDSVALFAYEAMSPPAPVIGMENAFGVIGREAPNADCSQAKLSRDCSEIQLAQDFDGYRAFRVPENERVVEFTGRPRVE